MAKKTSNSWAAHAVVAGMDKKGIDRFGYRKGDDLRLKKLQTKKSLEERFLTASQKAMLALEYLVELGDDTLRLKASEMILDRVLGKPTQKTELSGADGEAIEIHSKMIDAPPKESRIEWEERKKKELLEVIELKKLGT